jgi:hypothetical protein
LADLARSVARSTVRWTRLMATTCRASALIVAATALHTMVTPLFDAVGVSSLGVSSALAQTSQTITFGALANKTYGAAPFTVSATASFGLTVCFVSLTTPVCTVSGTTVTIVAAGTCTIQASQAGNSTYAPAPNVNQSFTVSKANQTISFTTLGSKTYGNAPFAVSATASSGLAVAFASTTPSVCTVSGSTVTLVAGGTCTIQASQAGNGNYNAALNVNQSFTVAKAAQTITFGALAGKTYGTPPFAVSATASSGLAITFSSTTSAVCTVSGSTVTIVTGGTCSIKASQAGNTNYLAATAVTQSFAVAKANQTITFAALAGKTYGAAPFTVSATASSALAVTFSSLTTTVCTVSGNTVTIKAAGTCTIQAAQTGNISYDAAPSVGQSFTVAKANQTITFGALANKTYGAAPFPVSATASSGLAVTFSSLTTIVCTVSAGTVTIKAGGTCTILAAQAGNTSYNAAPNVSQSFSVNPASQTITFPPLAQVLVGVPSTLSASASSGLPVAFASLTTATCTVSGSILSPVAVGTCTVQASQLGNGNYAPAPSVSQSVQVQVIPGAAFAPQVSYPTGAYPQGVVVGDFNADGKLDIVVSNVNDFTVSVFLGNGDGTFTLASTLPTGVYPEPVAVGDFNGDGKLDLVVGNTWTNTLGVYLGNGNGTFGPPGTIAMAGAPYGLAVADLNHDGKLDLVATDGSSTSVPGQTIEVLLGKGDGSFQTPTVYTVAANPQAIAIADFNGDGYLDVAVANYDGNSVSILLGRGDGTFGLASNVATNQGPRSLVVSDFNGDGKLDLASANNVSGDISILLARGDGTFLPANNIWTGSPATFLAVADFNGDGKADLAVTQVWTDNLGVLLGLGDGTFRPTSSFITGVSPLGLAVGDFNRDGKNDIVVVNHQSNTFSVLLNTTAFTPVATLSVQAGTPQSAAINTAYATPFTVLARDSANNPVAGAVVTFTASATGASGTFASGGTVAQAFTAASGVASAPTFTANGMSGSFSVVAAAGAGNAIFALTNTGGGPQAPTFTNGQPSNGVVNTPYTFTLMANGTPAPTFSVTSNALPPGLALNGTSGLINGTPSAIGTFAGMFTAANGVLPNATQTFAISIAGVAQTITFGALGNKPWGASPFTLSATASSGLAVSFTSLTTSVCTVSGSTVAIVNVGTCTIQASQAGNATYAPAQNVSQSFTITQASQTIAFGALANQPLGNPPFWLNATASSGLVVYFTSLTTSVCTISGNTVTLVTIGTCTLRASQPESTYYTAAPNVAQSFTVTTNQPPTVVLTAPAANSSYIVPVTVSLTAAASDTDGTVVKVEFYDGSNPLGSATAVPYTFTWTNVPAGTHTLTAKATDNLGATAISPGITIVATNLALVSTPLALSILSPTAGASLSTDLVHVTGTFSGPPNTGITVNGVVACTDGAHFYADNIELVPGDNQITVTATTLDGRTLTQTFTVASVGQAFIQVTSEPACGVAPLSVTFEVTSRSDILLNKVTIDYDGNGTIDYTSLSPTTPVLFGYPIPGTYQAQFTVTDVQGNVFHETLTIVVQDLGAADQMFQLLWNGMHAALVSGDKASALRYLNGPAQAKYDPVFAALMADMPTIVASYASFQRFAFTSRMTEYALNRMIDGVNRIFLINFMQDDDGVWRFDSM